MSRPLLVRVDLSDISSALELHITLKNALGFPDWYGCNWDAFWDAITGLVQLPEVLKLAGWDSLSQYLPRDAQLLQSCLLELASEYPQLAPDLEFCR